MNYLKTDSLVDETQIILCGHSEGTIHATALGATMKPAGIMFLAGGVDNLMEAIQKQRKLAYKELQEKPGLTGWLYRKLQVDDKNEKKFAKLLKKMQETDKDIIKVALFLKQPAKYFREHSHFNTREALTNVTCPVFAIQGTKDALVDNEVLNELPSLVKGESEIHIIEDMEHTLRTQPEPISVLNVKKMYPFLFKRPINEEALEKMSMWLTQHFK